MLAKDNLTLESAISQLSMIKSPTCSLLSKKKRESLINLQKKFKKNPIEYNQAQRDLNSMIDLKNQQYQLFQLLQLTSI